MPLGWTTHSNTSISLRKCHQWFNKLFTKFFKTIGSHPSTTVQGLSSISMYVIWIWWIDSASNLVLFTMASTSSVFNTKDLHFDPAPPITTSLPRWRPLYHQAAIDLALRVKGAVDWEVIGNGSVYSSITKSVTQNATIKKAHETYFTPLNVRRLGAGPPIKSCLDHITALIAYNLVWILFLLHLFPQTIWVAIPGFPVPSLCFMYV